MATRKSDLGNLKKSNSENSLESPTGSKDFKPQRKSLAPLIVFISSYCGNWWQGVEKRAGFGVWVSHGHTLNSSAPAHGHQTRQNAILQAATKAITDAHSQGYSDLFIYTTDTYVVNIMQNWVFTWEGNGWKKASGAPVKNLDEVRILNEVVKSMDSVKWMLVGKNKYLGTSEAAKLARLGARQDHDANTVNPAIRNDLFNLQDLEACLSDIAREIPKDK